MTPAGTAPTITSFTPSSGPVGTAVTISGNNFTGTSAVAFNGATVTSFTVVSDTQINTTVPAGATTGKISVTNAAGTGFSSADFIFTFSPTHDTRVSSSNPSNNYGTVADLRQKSSNPIWHSYLKFNVTGLSATVQSAKVRLFVMDDSPIGGSIFSVSNNYLSTSTPWLETGLNWNNAPAIGGTALSSLGAVSLNTWVEFDVTSAITTNGIYSFGLTSNSANVVRYSTKEGANPPQLRIDTTVGLTPPSISSFNPTSGVAGDSVIITGNNFNGATEVRFNTTVASVFMVDNNTQTTAIVPAGATTGPISVTTPGGTGTSASNFTVTTPVPPPTITSFTPGDAPIGATVTITGSNFTGSNSVAFNGTVATNFTVNFDTQITAAVPAGATSGKISVTNAGGTGFSTTDFLVNVLLNASFELDANNNNRPDNWTSNSRFTRSNVLFLSGSFAGTHFATNNSGYTIGQTVNSLTAGTSCHFTGWVNIPSTSDAFTFSLQVRWRDASNATISTTTVKTYAASTNGWDQATANLVAPAGTTNAQVRMVVTSLNATIYVDEFVFGP